MTASEFAQRLNAQKSGNGWKARCPAHNDHNPSLSIGTNDKGDVLIKCHAGCSAEQVVAAMGLSRRDLFANAKAPRRAKASKPFSWSDCVRAFDDRHAANVAGWRGYSSGFVRFLRDQALIGACQGNVAFPVHKDGQVVGCHYRWERGDRAGWLYEPTGIKTQPLIIGDLPAAREVWIFEGQWDAFAVMDSMGWSDPGNSLEGVAVFVTRGAANGSSVRGRLPSQAKVFAWPQNDEPKANGDIPSEKWMNDVVAVAGRQVFRVATPDLFKDANDWIRELDVQPGVLQEALGEAVRIEPPAVLDHSRIIEVDKPADLAALSAKLRGLIVEALTNKDLREWERKQLVSEAVVNGLRSVGQFYFHSEQRDFESCMYFAPARKTLDRIRSDAFGAWISSLLAINRTLPVFSAVLAAIETAALNPELSTGIIPEAYWASRPGAFYMSCGDGGVVKITAGGPRLVDNGADGVLFAAGKTMSQWCLVDPVSAFDTCQLFRPGRFVDEYGPLLTQLWTYSLPSNPRCKPPLCLTGDIGSGKTRLAKGIAELYGFPFVGSKVEESREDDFWVNCDSGGLYTLDNADTRCSWLPDALAAAATDGCSKRRKLYTNSDSCILRARAWLAITSANPLFASDAGLADRLLVVRMARTQGSTSDNAISDEIAINRDAGLSHIATTLATALADKAPAPSELNARHPDFAQLAVRVGRAIGRATESVDALSAAELDKHRFCLENDAVGSVLMALIESQGGFSGTAAELKPKLIEIDPDLDGKLSVKRLGKKLNALWPHVEGIMPGSSRKQDRDKFWHFALGTEQRAEFAEF